MPTLINQCFQYRYSFRHSGISSTLSVWISLSCYCFKQIIFFLSKVFFDFYFFIESPESYHHIGVADSDWCLPEIIWHWKWYNSGVSQMIHLADAFFQVIEQVPMVRQPLWSINWLSIMRATFVKDQTCDGPFVMGRGVVLSGEAIRQTGLLFTHSFR